MTTRHLGPGACVHCLAASGEPCAIKRKHRKGWRAPCVIEREEKAEAEFLAIWDEAMEARASRAEQARLAERRRQRRHDRAVEACVWLLVIAALTGLGWLHFHH